MNDQTITPSSFLKSNDALYDFIVQLQKKGLLIK